MKSESFLTAQFHEFYREVVRYKQQVQRGDWVFQTSEELGVSGGDRPAPSAVWQGLLTLLERQALVARRSGGDFAVEIYRQAQYLMAALADEIFLNLDWGGKESWQENLLEAHLFQSHRAGETIFQRLDKLLLRRDPVYLELARLYLFTLTLGFQGKYRGVPEGNAQLATFRRRLFNFISGREPELQNTDGHLFPTAYSSTVDRGAPVRLPYLRRWIYAFFILFLLWALIAHPIWRGLVSQMEPAIRSILGT